MYNDYDCASGVYHCVIVIVNVYMYLSVHVYGCVCVCVCVRAQSQNLSTNLTENSHFHNTIFLNFIYYFSHICIQLFEYLYGPNS